MGIEVKLDSGKLELAVQAFASPFLTGICDFVKAGPRNSKIQEKLMVYCNAPIQIFDLSAIGRTTMRIEIYAKDIGGFKDSTNLSAIREPIIKAIGDGITLEDAYFITLSNELSQADGNGFNFIFLNLAVTII